METAGDLASGRDALVEGGFDAVFVDQNLPDGTGTELLEAPQRPVTTEVVVITGHASVHLAVDAVQRGAADYLTKPTDPALLRAVLLRLARVRSLRIEVDELRRSLRKRGRLGALIGRSPAMQPVFDLVERVAKSDASVFIYGESGTGKELVASALHDLSLRRSGPLVAVNCGAISESLIESEMFGHEKGSFTGADRVHRGFFERANGGTLFLDEIAEMPMQLQVTLLRVLETGCVERVGSKASIRTDVRVLAATNRDPFEAMRTGKLREDLYFRLAVFPIRLPPLRDREGDVELLAQHFLDGHNQAHGTSKRWAPGALAILAARPWPGNTRELSNVVQRAYILAEDELTPPSDPAQEGNAASSGTANGTANGTPSSSFEVEVGCSVADVERKLVDATLRHVNGNKQAAADLLGFSLKTLYSRLNVYRGFPS